MPSYTPSSHARVCSCRTLSDVIYRQLRDQIILGRISPGTALSVRRVAKQWKVSPMPVREALRQLTADDLVDVAPRSATRVKNISRTHVRDICEMRNLLESVAARLAATYLTATDVARLCAWLQDMERAADMGRHTEWHRWNERFHTLMFRKCGNGLLERMARDMWERNFRHFTAGGVAAPGFRRRRGAEHRRIIRAIETRRPRAIEGARRAHTTQSGVETLEYLQHGYPAPEGRVAKRRSGVTARPGMRLRVKGAGESGGDDEAVAVAGSLLRKAGRTMQPCNRRKEPNARSA